MDHGAQHTWVVHEPAKPFRWANEGLYEAPRRLLGHIEGLKLQEMERTRGSAWCCGGGRRRTAGLSRLCGVRRRLEEARSTGASLVVTGCGKCQSHMGGVQERTAKPNTARVTGLPALLAQAASTGA